MQCVQNTTQRDNDPVIIVASRPFNAAAMAPYQLTTPKPFQATSRMHGHKIFCRMHVESVARCEYHAPLAGNCQLLLAANLEVTLDCPGH